MDLPGVPPDMQRKYIRLKGQIEAGYIPTRQEKLFLRSVERLTAMYVLVNEPTVHPKPRRLAPGKQYRPADFDEFDP